jgi:hypothetical protein
MYPSRTTPLPLVVETHPLGVVVSTLKSIRKRNAARKLPLSETLSLGCVNRAGMAFMLHLNTYQSKPGGKGMRVLGIPTVVDRLIQQALHPGISTFSTDCGR